ncbi:MAG: hypothetical protein ACYDBW_11955 [Sulfuricaulis sp.]
MKNCTPSEEMLNAWIDGELETADADRLEQLLRQDPGMRRHVEELREVRTLMRRAFDADVPVAPVASASRSWRPWLTQAIAAGLLLAVGIGIGWMWRAPAVSSLDDELTASGALVLRAVHPVQAHDNLNILLHVSSGDRQHMEAALDKTEKLLRHYQRLHRAVRLEVVANAGGIDLLRASTSPYARRIHDLQEHYVNLTFLACRNTLALLKAKNGTQVHLLPGVLVGPAALDHVMTRLEEGWAYIKA